MSEPWECSMCGKVGKECHCQPPGTATITQAELDQAVAAARKDERAKVVAHLRSRNTELRQKFTASSNPSDRIMAVTCDALAIAIESGAHDGGADS